MKRLISIFLVLALSFTCMIGCSSTAKTDESNKTAENSKANEEIKTESDWPKKPITMIIAYSAGGSADVVNRMLAKIMQEKLGTEITCINVEGASGAVAGQQVYDSDSDGYTIFGGLAHSSSGWKMLDYADLSWDNFYGFYAATSPYILFVKNGSQYETADDLIQGMADNPGKLKWGNAGLGSINHLTGEMFLNLLGVKANSLPYKGGRDAAIKVIANEVDFSWAGASDVMDLAETGEIKVLGVVDKKPLSVKSTKGDYEAPSLLEEYPDLSAVEGLLYWGMAVKRDTPEDVVLKLKEAFEYAVEQDEFKQLCESRYLEPHILLGQESDDMSAYLESVYAWGLADNGLAGKGITPESFNIPKPADYKWPPNDRAKDCKPWPAQ